MKVVSWNVNGLRASLRNAAAGHSQDLKGLLDSLGADIICFQETKATRVNMHEESQAVVFFLMLIFFL